MGIVELVRPYIEIAYFAAGVLLLIGVFSTVRQARLIKHDIELRTRRAAKEKAIEAASRYLGPFCKIAGSLWAEVDPKLPAYKGKIGDFTPSSIDTKAAAKRIAPAIREISEMLNELECVAAAFISGVADEETGFQIIGRTYCSNVETYYDVIAFLHGASAHPYYANIVRLYKLWRPRLDASEVEATIKSLQDKLASMPSGSSIPRV